MSIDCFAEKDGGCAIKSIQKCEWPNCAFRKSRREYEEGLGDYRPQDSGRCYNQHDIDVDKIKRLMDGRGLTRYYLTQIAGLGDGTLSKAFSRGKCRRETIRKIAAALGVKPGEITIHDNSGQFRIRCGDNQCLT